MIKVFRLSDLIKYFFKFIIPIIIIIICLNIFIKKGEREQQKLQDKETANTNIRVEETKEKSINSVDEKKENSQIADSKKDDTKKSDTKQDDSKLSKLNEKYKSSKLKSNLLSLFKKKDNEDKKSINTETADENKNKESNNTKTTSDNKDKESNAYYFCINSEIVNLKNVKDETKINFTSLLKKIIQSNQ